MKSWCRLSRYSGKNLRMTDRIPIRYDRALRPEWIDFALGSSLGFDSHTDQRMALRNYLEGQVTGEDARRKTVDQLMRIVGPNSQLGQERRYMYHQQMGQLSPDQRTPIRLQLLLESSAFFNDCVSTIRKFALLSDNGMSLEQLYERMIAKYGDRSIVRRSVRNVLTTLLWLGAVENRDHRWFVKDHHLVGD